MVFKKKENKVEKVGTQENLSVNDDVNTFNIDPQLIDILKTQDDSLTVNNEQSNLSNKSLEDLPINEFISLVLRERNISFKNLSSESLLENDTEDVIMENDSNNDNILVEQSSEESLTLTLEQFEKLKVESLQLINNAINESSLLLEMVSLLISPVKPKQGSLTMSPFLKQHLPIGSLNSDAIPMKQILENDVVKNYLIKLAWKLQSLKDIGNYYDTNFQRLNKQILIENKYWSIISDAKLIEKNCFIKNIKSNAISLKYGINGNQIANVAITNDDLDSFEVQLIPTISSHKISINSESDIKKDSNTIFKYVKVNVYDNEKNIIQSSSQLSDKTLQTLKNTLIKNNLADQLTRLNELQLQELLFATLKNECKQNINSNKEMYLKNENLIEITTLGKYKIVIAYENLLVEDLNKDFSSVNDSKLANDLLKLMETNLFYLNNLRSYNNIVNKPIYHSKKTNHQNKSNPYNYHNILFNLLVKFNHKYLIKSFVQVFESNSTFTIQKISDVNDDENTNEIAISCTDNSRLKQLKMKLNSYTPLITKPKTDIIINKGDKEYIIKVNLNDTKNYSLFLGDDSKNIFNNIIELLEYLAFISI
ncbi:hypothetical protein ACO0SA_004673 [Hanseniaspora valbyensis]